MNSKRLTCHFAALLIGLSAHGCCESSKPAIMQPGVDYYVPLQKEFILMAETGTPPNRRRVVIDLRQPLTIPGMSYCRALVFDENEKLLTSDTFSTGWRSHIRDAQIEKNPNLPESLLWVDTIQNNVTEPRRQYFALIDDRLTLVRFQHDDGALDRVYYDPHNWQRGPDESAITPAQWINRLESSDPAKNLAALVWLSGIRELSYTNVGANVSPALETYHAVRNAPRTQARIKSLIQSPNPWIRQAALLADTPTRTHTLK